MSNTETDLSAVQLCGIIKRFPGVLANDGVDFEARPGEIHALLGENGAGKSTLMQILSGLYRPDGGEIFIRGDKRDFKNPRESMASGIGMVYQHFMLVKKHTVIENVILGLKEFGFVIDYSKAEEKIKRVSRKYGLAVEPRARIWQLSVGQQQRVEIVKMLLRDVSILILDEPTAVLTPQETIELFTTLRAIRDRGKTVIFISHKLSEVMDICDRITVLRKGRKVQTVLKEETDEVELARMMVGRDVMLKIERELTATLEPVLSLENIKARDDRFLPALRDISFRVHRGEILGMAGVSGNGQKELEEVISGLRKPTGGQVVLDGKDVTGFSPGRMIREGFAYIPEDRLGVGCAPGLDYTSNIILKDYRLPPLASGVFLSYPRAKELASALRRDYEIQVPDPEAPVRLLSGGNLQKVILARELSSRPKFILAVHPTRGLDIGATEYVRGMLEKLKRERTAILLISEDLQELLSLSDRIVVIYEGEITATFDRREATMEKLGLSMTGRRGAVID